MNSLSDYKAELEHWARKRHKRKDKTIPGAFKNWHSYPGVLTDRRGGYHLDGDGFRLALLIAAVLLFIVLVTDMLTSGGAP